jgi:DNA-binding NarL/FixJ family response regulator
MIRLILADDHKIIRDGIQALLIDESDMQVVGAVANGADLLELLATVPADIVLLDINMPDMDGFTTIQHMAESFPSVRVLVLSMLDNENYIARMIDQGALGYILKTVSKEEMAHAIRMVAEGNHYICTEITLSLLKKIRRTTDRKPIAAQEKAPHDLSKREIEVLQLIAEGFTNADIAEKLFTSKRTIETHRQNLLEKTNSTNTATLIRYAITYGLVE